MAIVKILSIFVVLTSGLAVSQAATPVVRNDPLSVYGFDFSSENATRIKDVYGSCYRLEEPIFIELSAEGDFVLGKKSWISKVRFTLAQSKVIEPRSLSAKNTLQGVTWSEEVNGGVSRRYELGVKHRWNTLRDTGPGDMEKSWLYQDGWEVETLPVGQGLINNIATKRVSIPTRNLQSIEFIFESEANKNGVQLLFERVPGTNYMKNTSNYRPKNGQVNFFLEPFFPDNKLYWAPGGVGSWVPYDGFNLVRTERINFKGKQYKSQPSQITMGVYEPSFSVEADTEKYGFTAAEYDAACK